MKVGFCEKIESAIYCQQKIHNLSRLREAYNFGMKGLNNAAMNRDGTP